MKDFKSIKEFLKNSNCIWVITNFTRKVKKIPILDFTEFGNSLIISTEDFGNLEFKKSSCEKNGNIFCWNIKTLKIELQNSTKREKALYEDLKRYMDYAEKCQIELQNIKLERFQFLQIIEAEAELEKKFYKNNMKNNMKPKMISSKVNKTFTPGEVLDNKDALQALTNGFVLNRASDGKQWSFKSIYPNDRIEEMFNSPSADYDETWTVIGKLENFGS